MILDTLFHWAPAERHDTILLEGLKPFSRPTVASGLQLSYVCLSPSPSRAWSLSGALDADWHGIAEWDLWQVRLADTDDVHVRPDFGPEIQEVKIKNPIPPDRLWWVGRREEPACRPVDAEAAARLGVPA